LGHRREVYRPKTKRQVRNQIFEAIKENEFEKAVKLASFNYFDAPVADDFAISLIAAAEAIKIGRELSWTRDSVDLATIGLALAETKLEQRVNRYRRPIILESLSQAVEIAKKEAG